MYIICISVFFSKTLIPRLKWPEHKQTQDRGDLQKGRERHWSPVGSF